MNGAANNLETEAGYVAVNKSFIGRLKCPYKMKQILCNPGASKHKEAQKRIS